MVRFSRDFSKASVSSLLDWRSWFRNPDIEKSDIGNIPYSVECCYFTAFGRTETAVFWAGESSFYKNKVLEMAI
jgi:hypothetical protein